MEPEAYLIDTGGPDDNVPLETLAGDPDPLHRPSPELVAAVGDGGFGCLDRPVVPLLNALQGRGVRTLESCAGGMLFAEGVDRRTVAALRLARPRWAQMRWTVWADAGSVAPKGRTELWWSRRVPNWGGYLATDADWRWRRPPRPRAEVDAWLLRAADRLRVAPLPAADRSSAAGAWLNRVVATLVSRWDALGSAEWFEVVLCRDRRGWAVTARREYRTLSSLTGDALAGLRRTIDAAPERLLGGEGAEGVAPLRAALVEWTGRRPWSQLDASQRRGMIAVYSVAPSEHAAGRR